MFQSQWVVFFILLTMLAFGVPIRAGRPETGFLNRTMRIGAATRRYQVYVPADWTPRKKWPVVLFLHGAGERGDDGLIQTEVGIGTAIRRHRERFPCVVVMPQCQKERWWSEPDMQAVALKALDMTMKEFNGDPQRAYLTGLSMGGYGTWAIVKNHPGRFAALGVVCGGIRPPRRANTPAAAFDDSRDDPYKEAAQKVGKTPAWVFHGDADPVVPVSESRRMVEAIKAESGDARYSEYAGVGHNSWDRAYGDREFIEWMLAQKLAAPQKK